MEYRQRAYETYVSQNKRFVRQLIADPSKQDERNNVNLRYAMKHWLKPIPRNGAVLDLGCGDGNLLRMLKEEGFVDLHGVDISAEQTEIARRSFPQVVCGDAIEYLQKHTSCFALITAFDILEHFKKEEALKLLDAIFEALTPNGRLILQLPNGDSPFSGAVIHGDFTHEVTYTSSSLRHVLLNCGFDEIEFQEHSPQPTSLKGVIRTGLWKAIRQIIRGIHLVETGGGSTQIYTRVMRSTATKRMIS